MERPLQDNNKRYYNPYTDTIMSTIKKRRLNQGVENILPSPGLIGPPQRQNIPWPAPPLSTEEVEALT